CKMRPMRALRVAWGLFVPALVLSGGCALVLGLEETTLREDPDADVRPDGPVPEGAAPDGGDAGTSLVSVEPASLTLRRGAQAVLTVTVTRPPVSGSLEGEVTIALGDLPTGVTAPPALVPEGARSATITLSARADAVLGSRLVRVEVVGRPDVSTPSLALLVADAPGAPDVTFDADGMVVVSTEGMGATFHALAVAPDGTIVAGGSA